MQATATGRPGSAAGAPRDPAPETRGRLVAGVLLALLTAAALSARLAHLDYLLPQAPEPDRYAVAQVRYLWDGGSAREAPVDFWWYPSLFATALSLTPAPRDLADPSRPASLEAHLQRAAEPVLRARTLVAWLGALGIPLTYALARRFLGPAAALAAAALLATSLLHLQFSTQARLHAAQGTAGLLAVVAALRLRESPTLARYAAAGLAATLAVGVLQNGVFVLPAVLAAHALRERRGLGGVGDDLFRRELRAAPRLLAVAVPVLFALAAFYPFLLQQGEDARRDFTDVGISGEEIELGPQRLRLAAFDGSGFERVARFLAWNDPVLGALALAGLALGAARWLRSRRARPAGGSSERGWERPLLVAASHALPYFLVLGTYGRTHERFVLPLLPYLACLGAAAPAAAGRALARVGGPRARPAALVLPACVALALPTVVVAKLLALRSRPDTIELAARWLREHATPVDVVAVTQGLTLPVRMDDESLAATSELSIAGFAQEHMRGLPWLEYQERVPRGAFDAPAHRLVVLGPDRRARGASRDFALRRLRRARATWAVLEISSRAIVVPGVGDTLRAVQQTGPLAARFAPRTEPADPDRPPAWLDYQGAPWNIARVLRAQRLGPPIEVYDLRGAWTPDAGPRSRGR